LSIESCFREFLHIRAGESLSLQYHRIKTEIHVVEGKLLLRIGKTEDSLEERILSPGDSCDIPPGTVPQMEALENCVIAEVSTPQLGDVVRLRDRYGREDSPSDRG
jgi:mannose-6-phosphate isomerase